MTDHQAALVSEADDVERAAGRSKNVREADEPQTDDRYLPQLWPAPPEPARLLKQTGSTAASWHDFAASPVG